MGSCSALGAVTKMNDRHADGLDHCLLFANYCFINVVFDCLLNCNAIYSGLYSESLETCSNSFSTANFNILNRRLKLSLS